ncbi:MAG: hypothetical protein ABFD98_11690 [Syntrophobacteraceae bacterium]
MEKAAVKPESSLSALETGALVVSGLLLIVLFVAFLPVVGILIAIPVMVMALSFLLPREQASLHDEAYRVDETEGPVTLFDLPVSAKGPVFSVEGPRIDTAALSVFTGNISAEAGK